MIESLFILLIFMGAFLALMGIGCIISDALFKED
jgi:hypothetical protein